MIIYDSVTMIVRGFGKTYAYTPSNMAEGLLAVSRFNNNICTNQVIPSARDGLPKSVTKLV